MTETMPAAAPKPQAEVFTFGDPTPVMDGRDWLDYLESYFNGRWYEPPVPLDGLAKAVRASVYLQSGLMFKRNLLARTFIPHRWLSRQAFEQLSLDWLSLGNGYLEERRNRLGQVMALVPALARYVRRGKADDFYFVQGWKQEHAFAPGSVFQLREADVNQEIYGLPEWYSAMQSALLNESATLFRRKYYNNGSHAGFILYLTDPAQQEEDVNALRTALKNSRGPGNFRNLFYYAPGGKEKGLQLIPVGEVAAKDDFASIKNISRDDQLAGLRIPPQLIGIVPQNAGGFGSIRDAATVFFANEIEPLQTRMEQINDWVGEEVIRFQPFELPGAA